MVIINAWRAKPCTTPTKEENMSDESFKEKVCDEEYSLTSQRKYGNGDSQVNGPKRPNHESSFSQDKSSHQAQDKPKSEVENVPTMVV